MMPASDDSAPIEVDLGPYKVAIASAFGPRVLGLRRGDGPQVFARHDQAIEHPDVGSYQSHGGHRLWVAPEVPAVTYAADDHPCQVRSTPGRVTIEAPPDSVGFVKAIDLTVEQERIIVAHRLVNGGSKSRAVAPWGITQLRLGGKALLPVGGPQTNEFQGDRSLVLWPYTNLADRRLAWREKSVVIDGSAGPRLKLGSGPSPGRIGYLLDNWLFIKHVTAGSDADYPDRGAVAQVFVADTFCELESVGPITLLQPGASTSLEETWELEPCGDLDTAHSRLLGAGGG